jgi:hypothetical protein
MRYVGRPSLGDSYLSTSPRFGGASFFSATFSPNCNDAVRGYMQPGASRQRQRIVARLPMAAMRRSIPGRTRQQRNEKPRRKAGAANIAEGEYDVRVRKGQVSSCHGRALHHPHRQPDQHGSGDCHEPLIAIETEEAIDHRLTLHLATSYGLSNRSANRLTAPAGVSLVPRKDEPTATTSGKRWPHASLQSMSGAGPKETKYENRKYAFDHAISGALGRPVDIKRLGTTAPRLGGGRCTMSGPGRESISDRA